MDSSELDQADKSSPEPFSDSSLSSDSPDSNDIFGESLVHPRVGDEYQVEIPSIRNKSELHLMVNTTDSGGVMDSSHSFLIGLPMPVMWICNQASSIKGGMEARNNLRAVHPNGLTVSGNNLGMNNISSVKEELNAKVDAPDRTYCLVPGQSSAPWSDFEADCFLVGLYIFGKDFAHVMRFMESKGVGQILAYYYGRFYGSTGYHRWSECRKMRNKKCVLGHRFFTGYRQHELFVRLAPRLSEESRSQFLEVCRAFVEGRTTLEEYVSSLKTLAGIHAFVEAVGIGKGKDDLTTLNFDGTKNNQLFAHRPEIPSGKACSSLTCAEIVKFLTGDFRLSKARSNDLFWEAVWPRLLARGWHSEQPSGDNYAGSKNCLVFLMPGIKKFSRGKLSKGDHYFDSVSDVLAKIANEPELLELEADETPPSSSKVENGGAIDVKLDVNLDLSDHERHCYLKPRVSSDDSNLFKFTVVDTSLANEDNPHKVRILRTLPLEVKRCASTEKSDKLEVHAVLRNGHQTSTTLPHSGVANAVGACEKLSCSHNLVLPEMPCDTNLLKDHKLTSIKHQFSRCNKVGIASCSSGQVTKRWKLASRANVTFILALPARTYKTKIKLKTKNGAASKAMTNNNVVPSRVTQSDDANVLSTKSLVECTSDVKIFQDKSLVDCGSSVSLEKENLSQEPEVIDLNMPQVEPESNEMVKLKIEPESVGKIKLEVVTESDGNATAEEPKNSVFQIAESKELAHSKVKDQLVSCVPIEPINKVGDILDQQQPRRQSTRNRPLTTKALEALEIGLLDPVRHSRKRSSLLPEQKSKRSRQPHSNSSVTESLGNAISVEKATMTCDLLSHDETSFTP